MNVRAYIDGESHWIRSENAWRKLHGQNAILEHASVSGGVGSFAYPNGHPPHIRIFREGKFFWDVAYGDLARAPLYGCQPISGAVYFTDFSGGNENLHSVKVAIRNQGFEPKVIEERSQLAKRRNNRLVTDGVLEKPKGLDISLAVRILEDAYHNIFDFCYLFTSDVDYAPVIHAIQHLGKRVVVFGYGDGQGNNTELEHLPDQFIDLEERMRKYAFTPSAPAT